MTQDEGLWQSTRQRLSAPAPCRFLGPAEKHGKSQRKKEGYESQGREIGGTSAFINYS